MRRLICLSAVFVIVAMVGPAITFAEHHEKDHARALGLKSDEALKNLFKQVPDAEKLYEKASGGWAYFKMDGGDGVAMIAGSRKGFPMSVAQAKPTGGSQEWILMFQTNQAYDDFVDGWEAGDTPKANERMAGLATGDGFVNGVKVYAINGDGTVADTADISTAKFRKGFHEGQHKH